MIEYKVRTVEGSSAGDMESILNEAAKDGWRLVNTETYTEGTFRPRVYLFLERETSVQEKQDAWRVQHERLAP
jgi:hypothetical protein